MQDKIEVGEYVRYTGGYIDIVKEIMSESGDETGYAPKHIRGKENSFITYDRVVKHSKNIKKLIEAGDYVNGYKVISVDYDVENPYIDCIELDLNNNYQYNFISINQIKSIVTKEQFQSMEYKVGE